MSISPTSIKVAALGSLVAVGAGLGIASASAATNPAPQGSTASAASGTQANTGGAQAGASAAGRGPAGQRGPGGHAGGGMRGLDAAALAKDLGVTEAKVTAALQKVHEALKPATPPKTGTSTTAPTPPTAADKTARDKAFVSALAKELGVDEAKVTAALAKERAAHEAQHKAELTTRLDAAVTAGKLTASDKAAVLKAFDAGVLAGPAGGPRG